MDDEEVEKVENEDYEPVVTSPNPAERKAARRLRISRRTEALAKLAEGPDEECTLMDLDQKPPIDAQMEKSTLALEQLQIDATEFVTNVKIANESRETNRRERDGFNRDQFMQELEDEATQAEAAFNEIAAKWSGILRHNDPLHINEDIQAQKEKCDELIRQKDAIITNLKAQIRTAEINFAKDQRKQCEDVDAIARRIEK